MHAGTICFAAVLVASTPALAQHAVRATLTDAGAVARLELGKTTRVQVGKGKPMKLFDGLCAGAIESGHGRVVVALAIEDGKRPFRIATLVNGKLANPLSLKRPAEHDNVPFAVALTATPTGFTVFFQEIEAGDANEAHTYLVKLDEEGALVDEPVEVAVPWALAAAVWNGNGYHLGLLYTGEGRGARLSMVSTDEKGVPEQHPDWASKPGAVADVHLVATGRTIRAFYRGTGNRLLETDVTKIGEWGQDKRKVIDHGALAKTMAIAITAKGTATKVTAR